MIILTTLVPIFALVFLGMILRQVGFASDELFRGTNRLVYYVGVPAMLFYKIAQAHIEGDAIIRLFAVLLGGTLIATAVAYGVAWLIRLPWRSVGAFVQGSYRGNTAYIGLTVVLFALAASDGTADPAVEALGVLAVASVIPVYNIGAVLVLLASQENGTSLRRRIPELMRKIATNPLLLASVAGLAYSASGLPMPAPVNRTLATLSQMSLPLALLGIGSGMRIGSVRDRLGPSIAASLVKVGVAPLAGVALTHWIGLAPAEYRIAIVYLACPTAVASYVMAEQLGGDAALAGNIVVVTTLFSMVSLAVALMV